MLGVAVLVLSTVDASTTCETVGCKRSGDREDFNALLQNKVSLSDEKEITVAVDQDEDTDMETGEDILEHGTSLTGNYSIGASAPEFEVKDTAMLTGKFKVENG